MQNNSKNREWILTKPNEIKKKKLILSFYENRTSTLYISSFLKRVYEAFCVAFLFAYMMS